MSFRHACALAALACATGVLAAPTADHPAEKQQIQQQYAQALARCALVEGHGRELCETRARGQRSVQLAALQARLQPTPDNQRKLRIARAEAAYEAAMLKCTAMLGAARSVCRQDAEAVLAAEKRVAGTQATVVTDPGAQAERIAQAQLKAARERCDMQPEPAQPACLADANRRFRTM